MRYQLLLLKLKLSLWLARLRHLLLGNHVEGLFVDTANGQLIIPMTDFHLARHLAYSGTYDMVQITRLLTHINEQSHVLIVGGHIGALAIPLGKKAATLDVIEANPDNARYLKMNLELNGLGHATIHPFAAADKTGEITFLLSTHNSGGSKIKQGEMRREFIYDTPREVTVPTRSLDAVFPEQDFDLIVMDIEGAESLALSAMPNILSRCKALQIEVLPNHIEHVAGSTPQAFAALLTSHFSTFLITNEANAAPQPVSTLEATIASLYDTHYFDGRDILLLE